MNNELMNELHLVPASFEPIFLGDKTGYICMNYHGYEDGEVLTVREKNSETGIFTGRVCEVEITHIEPLFSDLILMSITLVG
ncbi:DUF3850 domain-containing protein [Bradyrhizobium sp. SZCCHNRI2049]|uniref:DUF3850 domain-containing protein n=1 Tax=Bradyrhizobium sp. SZCCHNRI2049 TaxID=3057287 RepID=UPI00291614AF|nr:DUF3850 domain-containing protein [Bradyrhizobium sp. SZCCHNRI2049]